MTANLHHLPNSKPVETPLTETEDKTLYTPEGAALICYGFAAGAVFVIAAVLAWLASPPVWVYLACIVSTALVLVGTFLHQRIGTSSQIADRQAKAIPPQITKEYETRPKAQRSRAWSWWH